MSRILTALTSQVGRKYLTGLTGVLLMLFVVVHLTGNLAMFGDVHAMNEYSHFLHELGPLLWIARIGLLVIFTVHIYIGISIWLNKRKARPQKYEVYSSKGGPSRQTLSSRSMAFTGVVLLIFIVFHLRTFAFGGPEMIEVGGVMMKDIKSLVLATFQSPGYAFGYTFVMLLLGVHLGHGFWSAFVSLGFAGKTSTATLYTIGTIYAVVMAVGFLFIPLYIYFGGGCDAALIQCVEP